MTAADEAAATQGGGESIPQTLHWRDDVRARALARLPHGPERPTRVRRFAWAAAVVFHLLLVLSLRIALQRPSGALPQDEQVLDVDLIDAPVAEPALPSPAPPPRRTAPPPPALPQPAQPPPADQIPNAESIPEPRLFNPDGSVALPRDIDAQIERMRPQPDFIPRRYDPSPLLLARRPLKVRPNHFAASWVGTDGQPLSQTIFQPLTFVTEFRAPWGGRYACGWILILVACGDIPDKPWNAPQTWKPASVFDEQ